MLDTVAYVYLSTWMCSVVTNSLCSYTNSQTFYFTVFGMQSPVAEKVDQPKLTLLLL